MEKQKGCNCEMERQWKQEETREGGVKTAFPRGSFGKTMLRKLPKLQTRIPSPVHTCVWFNSAKSYEIQKHRLNAEMWEYVCGQDL